MRMQDLKKFDEQTNHNRKVALLQREKDLDAVAKTIMGLKLSPSLGDKKANRIKKEISVLKSRIY